VTKVVQIQTQNLREKNIWKVMCMSVLQVMNECCVLANG